MKFSFNRWLQCGRDEALITEKDVLTVYRAVHLITTSLVSAKGGPRQGVTKKLKSESRNANRTGRRIIGQD